MQNIRSQKGEKIEAQRKSITMDEVHLQSFSSMVVNLHNTNGLIATKATKLRDEADVSTAEKKN